MRKTGIRDTVYNLCSHCASEGTAAATERHYCDSTFENIWVERGSKCALGTAVTVI